MSRSCGLVLLLLLVAPRAFAELGPVPAAEWPPKTSPEAWPMESRPVDRAGYVARGVIPDAVIEITLRRFVQLTVQQLLHDNPKFSEITMDMLVRELCRNWCERTPYESTATFGAAKIGKSVFQQKNAYQLIIRRGFGICGDHQLLVMRLVDLAMGPQYPQIAHLREERGRVQPLSLRGYSDLRVIEDSITVNHAAIGVMRREVYLKVKGPDGRVYRAGLVKPSDIDVYDIWSRPPILGTQDAHFWGVKFTAKSVRTILGLGNGGFSVDWGSRIEWSYRHFSDAFEKGDYPRK